MRLSSSSSSQWVKLVVFICVSSLALFPWRIQAQANTDSTEVAALNAIFNRWGLQLPGNTPGDPCRGNAIDDTPFENVNPFIKCNCSFENGTVCHITQLDMRQNLLTGNLPSFLGNLTAMQYMSFGINSLSGPIPKELGKLTNLVVLSFSSNNFNGPLPAEIGNLTNLQQSYIDSAGVSGEIPSTFAKLLKLKIMRIGDLTNGSSSLAFIQNLTTLSTLVLRNCKISDNIPSNIGSYSNLILLDLSYNNFSGSLPSWVLQKNLNLTW